MFWNSQNAQDKTSVLQAELDSLRSSQILLANELKQYKDGSSSVNTKRMAELEEKLALLKDERTDLYKTQGQNVQKLLTANENAKKLEEALKQKNGIIEELNTKISSLTNQLSQAENEKHQKDITIQVLQDELTALQLELLTSEERMNNLIAENRTLVDRWVNKMNEEAQKMNLANEMLQNAKIKNEISEFVPFEEEKIGKGHVCKFPKAIVAKLTPHKTELTGMDVSSDGKLIATSSVDNTIVISDVERASVKSVLQGSLQGVLSVAFDGRNQLIAGGACDSIARIWNVSSGRVWHTLTGHTGKVSSVIFSLDSSKLYSGSHDRSLKLWDVPRGFCTRTIFASSICNSVSAGSNSLLVSGHLDMNIRFWDERVGTLVKDLGGLHTGQVTSVSISTGDGRDVLTNSRDNTMKLVDMRTFNVVQTFKADGYKVGLNWIRAHCSPDDRYVIAGSTDGTVCIWNKHTAKLETVLKGNHKSPVVAAMWSPIGNSDIVSAEKDGSVFIWK